MRTQALSISPGDPITCDLLKLALDEVSAHTARNAHPFPGLPPRVLQSLDEQVAALNAEILAGIEPEPLECERSAAMDASAVEEGMSRSEDMVEMSFGGDENEDEDDGDEGEGETMDMTGE